MNTLTIDLQNGHGSGITSESISSPDLDSVSDTQSITTLLIISNAGIVSACQMYRIAFRIHTNRPPLQAASLSSLRNRVISSEVDHE